MLTSKHAARDHQLAAGRHRFKVGDLVMATSRASGDYRDRRGLVTEISDDGTECRVEFDDGLRPTTGYLEARSLDFW